MSSDNEINYITNSLAGTNAIRNYVFMIIKTQSKLFCTYSIIQDSKSLVKVSVTFIHRQYTII